MTSLLFSRRVPLDHLFPLWFGALSPFSLLWFLYGPTGAWSMGGWCCLALGLLGTTYASLEGEEALLLDQPLWSATVRQVWPFVLGLLAVAGVWGVVYKHASLQLWVPVLFAVLSWLRAWSPQLRWTRRGLWKLGRNPAFVPISQFQLLSLESDGLVWQSTLGPQWQWTFSSNVGLEQWAEMLPTSPPSPSSPHPQPPPLPALSRSPLRWLLWGGWMAGGGFWLFNSGLTQNWGVWEWGLWAGLSLSLSRLSMTPFETKKSRQWRWFRQQRDAASFFWRRIALPAGAVAFLLGLVLLLRGQHSSSAMMVLFWSWMGLLSSMDVSGAAGWTGWTNGEWWIRQLPFGERLRLSEIHDIQPTESGLHLLDKQDEPLLILHWEPEICEEVLGEWKRWQEQKTK